MTRRSSTRCASGSSSSNTARSSETSHAGCTARHTDLLSPRRFAVRCRPPRTIEGSASMRSHFVLQEIWIGLRRNLTMTMALIVVVAISLSLLGTGLLFVKQVDRTRTYWQGKVELSIYLCIKTSPQPRCQQNGPATDAERQQLQHQLQSMPQVQTVYYVSQQQAYSEFRQYFSNQPAMVQGTQEGDIPDSFEVKLKNPEADYNIVASAVTGALGVETVVDEMTILDKFYRLLAG